MWSIEVSILVPRAGWRGVEGEPGGAHGRHPTQVSNRDREMQVECFITEVGMGYVFNK